MKIDSKAISVTRRWGSSELDPPRGTAGFLEVENGAVTAQSGFSVPLSSLECGWILADQRTSTVVLRSSSHFVTVSVASKREANALLKAAGVAPSQRALTLVLGLSTPIVLAMTLGIGVLGLLPMLFTKELTLTPMVLGIYGLTIATTLAVLLFLQQKLTLGRDGLVWQKGFSRTFVAIEDIAGVEADTFRFRILRRKGKPLLLWEWQPTADTTEQQEKDGLRTRKRLTQLLEERIRVLRSIEDAVDPTSARFAPLDRNGRDDATWQRELLTVLTAQGDYRQGSFLTQSELIALCGHPDAPEERRKAAAFALRSLGEERALELVTPTLEAIADQKLVERLERAVRGELT